MCYYRLIYELWSVVWLDDQGCGRYMIGDLMARKFGKETYRKGNTKKKNEDIYICQRMMSTERILVIEKIG